MIPWDQWRAKHPIRYAAARAEAWVLWKLAGIVAWFKSGGPPTPTGSQLLLVLVVIEAVWGIWFPSPWSDPWRVVLACGIVVVGVMISLRLR